MRGQELLILLVVVLLLFGARKLPELARSLGSSAKEFRAGLQDGGSNETRDVTREGVAPETRAEARGDEPGDNRPSS